MATETVAILSGGSGGSGLLPRNISTQIWENARAASIVPTLSTAAPIILGDNTFPTVTKRPAASIVGEGGNKPASQLEVGAKTITPIKAVVGLEFTMEAIMTNPGGVLGLLQGELGDAIGRQIDLAVLHGRQASDGAAISGGRAYINQTSQRVNLTTAAASDSELWDGYGLVVDNNDFSGFAMDPRLVFSIGSARNATTGVRLNPDIQMGDAVTTYSGQRVAVSKTVSGQVDASGDTKVRGFGGDWNALRFGYALDLFTKKIEYGDPFGNGDLQRRNAVAYLTEVIFGWAIMDLDAFVAYDAKTVSSVALTPTTATVGTDVQMVATATYSDGSTAVVSSSAAAWTSATPAKATISTTGLLHPVAAGTSSITATFGGQTGTQTVTVS